MQFRMLSAASARFALLLALLVGCVAQAVAESGAMMLPVDPTPLVVETGFGEVKFEVEVADDPAERSMGLMFREFLPPERGMLFVFERTQPVGFWMKNTKLPLDLIFIGEDGRVKAIRQGEPMSEAAIAPDGPVRFVLELNAGTAAARGIASGSLIRHPEIQTVAGQGSGKSPG